MSIPWYYMWSEKYRFFHELFLDTMKEPEFLVTPIHIDQSYFDSNLYKIEGKHSWNGCSLKIDLLIDRLETASSSYIIFSDIDIIAKDNIYKNLKVHIDNNDTMVFLQEGSEGNNINIGFILLKVCPEVIEFWKLVKTKMNEIPGHDQEYTNNLIKEYKGKWTRFHDQIFTCSNIWKGRIPFSIMQPLSSCLGKEFDFAEKIYSSGQVCDIQKYVQYIPPNIIPYVLKFQELIKNSTR